MIVLLSWAGLAADPARMTVPLPVACMFAMVHALISTDTVGSASIAMAPIPLPKPFTKVLLINIDWATPDTSRIAVEKPLKRVLLTWSPAPATSIAHVVMD